SAIIINLDRDSDFTVKKGDKICQLVIKKIEQAELTETDCLDVSGRGEGGFGSTGT
ncbi:MAG: dUTP diphosphatase, partial [Actinobacteria bacterium]|nr:dUTP diphosphatase [Actinomycetota bacterium]